MPAYVLMVNSGKAEAVDRLRAVAPDAEIDVITESAYARMYAPDVRLHFVDDIADLTAVRRVALDLLARQPIDHVVAPSERSLPAGGYLRSFLGLGGIGFETANRFSHKAVMKSTLAAAGLPVAPYRVIGSLAQAPAAAAELGWPVVLKPALGTGSMNTFAVSSERELTALLDSPAADGLRRAACPLLVERFVEMEGEYHCDGVVSDGTVEFASVQRYFMPLLGCTDDFTGSYLLPEEDPDVAAVRELHRATVDALGLESGVTHMELFRTGNGFVIGEISCRPAGGGIVDAVKMKYGIDLWQVFMDTALGRPAGVRGPVAPLREGTIANCDLPVRPGRVVRVSTPDELAAVPDVIEARMSTRVGDVISPRLHSASTTGLVFLATAEPALVAKRVEDLAGVYVLEVEPV
ncbi:ATP-grasp domain-containing protein [Streptomyces sp. NPDC006641]|uniref:ATP-grasp domain-containing protein n=1 Tax=unclassified Streptomyces TaxID=2593676 RepID=UPI002E7A7639|nr:ATP-grasp domain-containing protein [Streptomyces sp. JV184]MEE1750533.1 ATP-grasp domain-containing protein [Streptomyces sp. JV184]